MPTAAHPQGFDVLNGVFDLPQPRRPRTEANCLPAGERELDVQDTGISTSPNAVYFDEGHGYLFVRPLGMGTYGTATLVRAIHESHNTLIVRKEELGTSRWGPNISADESREVSLARLVQHIENVSKLRGSVRHINKLSHNMLDVSYWDFCNLGSMGSIRRAAEQQCLRFPEDIIRHWLCTMLKTMIEVQKADIIHPDANEENWLLHYDNETEKVRIILGGFGLSKHKSEVSKPEWHKGCRLAFFDIVLAIYGLGGWTYLNGQGLLSNFLDYQRRRPHFSDDLVDILLRLEQPMLTVHETMENIHSHITAVVDTLVLGEYATLSSDISHLPFFQPVNQQYASYEQAKEYMRQSPCSYKIYNQVCVVEQMKPGIILICGADGEPAESKLPMGHESRELINKYFGDVKDLGQANYEVFSKVHIGQGPRRDRTT